MRDLILRDTQFAAEIVGSDPASMLDRLIAGLLAHAGDEQELRRLLRVSRARAAATIALADIGGAWTLDQVTRALTRFAEASLRAALNWLLVEAQRTGKLTSLDEKDPGQDSGYTILGMGKFGAHELNYSSDIDLIVLYDPQAARLADGVDPSTFFVRLTKRLVVLLQDMTEDGYVFRIDLRLRPDPRATQIAISIEAAAIYYENMGQNWERAAMIKARPVAGDIAFGEEFLDRLVPYIWRKYLDFAAIADVQSLKRQIHAVKGHGTIAVLGHNIKLGRGGIREIEFFVQTQQLIAGGRNPNLRGRRTVDMLGRACRGGVDLAEAAEELIEAYRLPARHRASHPDGGGRADPCSARRRGRLRQPVAAFGLCGSGSSSRPSCARLSSWSRATMRRCSRMPRISAPKPAALSSPAASDDPETLETLTGMGFKRASEIAAMVRGWHFGRYPAPRAAPAPASF